MSETEKLQDDAKYDSRVNMKISRQIVSDSDDEDEDFLDCDDEFANGECAVVDRFEDASADSKSNSSSSSGFCGSDETDSIQENFDNIGIPKNCIRDLSPELEELAKKELGETPQVRKYSTVIGQAKSHLKLCTDKDR